MVFFNFLKVIRVSFLIFIFVIAFDRLNRVVATVIADNEDIVKM